MTIKARINSKFLKFRVRIVVEKDEPGYHAYAPSLRGLHMPGDTQKEALDNAREAAALMLKCMIEDGDPIPIDILAPQKEGLTVNVRDHASSSLEEIQVTL